MKSKWSHFGLYAGCLLIGLLWLNEIDTRGYDTDSKHGFAFYGNEGTATACSIIALSVIGMIHTTIMNWGPQIKIIEIGTVLSIGISVLAAVVRLEHHKLPFFYNTYLFFFWVLVLLGSPISLLLALTTIYTILRVPHASSKAPLLLAANALGLIASMYFIFLVWAFVWGPH